jgi:cytidylate kinase
VRAITISREFGAGGGEVARRLAGALGWALLDRELLHRAAELEHVPDAELERLDEQAIGLTDRLRLHPPHQAYIHGLREAACQAAERGDVVVVGRGSRHLLGDVPGAFHLRLVAPAEQRARTIADTEHLTAERARARILQVDRARARFMKYFFGASASLPSEYDLVVNTARIPLDQIVDLMVAVVRGELAKNASSGATGGRVLTLARELGAGDTGFAPTLAERLGLACHDRRLLEEEAVRMGIPESEMEKLDESPAGIFERFQPGSTHRRYVEVLRALFRELATDGEVLLVGRGGSRFLRDHPRAFHARLVAPMPTRLRRVMEYRWVAEPEARHLIATSDDRRRRFYRDYFGADWSDPLEYSMTVNSGRLGSTAVDLVALAAERSWTAEVRSS